MKNIFDRLQFARHDEVFETREDAYSYVINHQILGNYPGIDDPSKNRPSLVAEPMVLLYNSGDELAGPNVILAIGSAGDGTASNANRTYFIDTQKTEDEIEELREELEAAIRAFTIKPLESDTLKLYAEKKEDGTYLSGNVKTAGYQLVDGVARYNAIQVLEEGLYTFIDMAYDEANGVLKFMLNSTTKEFQLPKDQHLTKAEYDTQTESIIFTLADGTTVSALMTKLIEEWTVLPDGQTINGYDVSGTTVHFTPIVFAKTHVGSRATEHEGIYEWQDVLEADIRVADHIGDNIIHKDRTGRYLYVKGTADNIKYKDGKTVKDALDNIDTKVSSNDHNLITKRPDGLYAYANLNYSQVENKIVFSYSEGDEIKTSEFVLNSIKLLEDITYDATKECIVIRYIDARGEYQRVEIPVKDIIEEWTVNNDSHSVKLTKYRSQGSGEDILSADAKIYNGENNILTEKNHELYVEGTARNIKFNLEGNETVKTVLDNLIDASSNADAGIDELQKKIGSGFTTDPHENVTYKFEQLNSTVNDNFTELSERIGIESEKLDAEIYRSTEKDNELTEALNAEIERSQSAITNEIGRATDREDEIDAKIGGGFDEHDTVRDAIDALSADTSASIKDVINNDHSINIDKSNAVKPIIAVNLSEEVEDGKMNIIKLNNDGLWAGVDLNYVFGEGKNELVFSTTNGTKVFELKTASVIDKIYYDSANECIVVEYTINGVRQPDVIIPVGDLISEWRVSESTSGAVRLSLQRQTGHEQDVLFAETVISNLRNNMLVNNDGALYVSDERVADAETAIADNVRAIEELSEKVDENIITVGNTSTIALDKTENRITGNVLIANGESNIIKASSDDINGTGVYASVDMDYNASTNTIILKTSAGEKSIALNMGSILKSVVYDDASKSLIIKYDVISAGQVIEQTITVPVEDLFNDWTVQEGNHMGAIQLTKIEGVSGQPDILSAATVISSLEDNMLINDMGALYVSNRPIMEVSGQLETFKEEYEESLNTVETDTLVLSRDAQKHLQGDVKLSHKESQLIVVDGHDGLLFDGAVDYQLAGTSLQFRRLDAAASAENAKRNILAIDSTIKKGEMVIGTYFRESRDETAAILAVKDERGNIFFIDNQTILDKIGINDDGSVNSALTDSLVAYIERVIAADGLNPDGTYIVNTANRVISGATSLADSDNKMAAEILDIENFIGMGPDATGKSLVEKIDEISGKSVTKFDETESVKFTVEEAEDGTKKAKADVKLSNGEGNILLQNTDGLYTQVDYNPLTNAIIINGQTKQLNSGSIIDSIEYIATGTSAETLVITYHTTGSQEELKVSVPLADLIEEYVFDQEEKTPQSEQNVKFKVTRNVDGNSRIEADVEYIDCGDY